MSDSDTILCNQCGANFAYRPLQSNFSIEYVRSLFVPSKIEASSILSIVAEAERDLLAYDKEIQRLEDTTRQLTSLRARLTRFRDEHRSLLSPIRKLPAEVLGEIFSFACLESGYALKLTRFFAKAVTMSLSQVCSAWRSIVVSSPRLWSSLWIDLSHERFGEEIVGRYLQCSARAPLELYITTSSDTSEISLSQAEEMQLYDSLSYYLEEDAWNLLVVLMKTHNRWKDVTIRLRWDDLCSIPAETHINVDLIEFPLLETLTLCWDEEFDSLPDQGFMPMFARAPKLRHLHLSDYFPWFSFPFHQLKSFDTIDRCSTSIVVDFLRRCTDVRSFSIIPGLNHRHHVEFDSVLPQAVSNVNARALSLLPGDDWMAINLLSHLSADKLEELVIEGNDTWRHPDSSEWDTCLIKFVSRSCCPLQKLTLQGIGTANGLLDFLSHVPTLTYLKLILESEWNKGDIFFERLTNARTLLPNLQNFDLVLSGPSHLKDCIPSASTMVAAAESRSLLRLNSSTSSCGTVTPLQSFTVILRIFGPSSALSSHDPNVVLGFPFLDSETETKIGTLVKTGMKVKIGIRKA